MGTRGALVAFAVVRQMNLTTKALALLEGKQRGYII